MMIEPEIGICILHRNNVSMSWALAFRRLELPKNHVFKFNMASPYDTAREMLTRECLELGAKWVFHLDSDVIVPTDTVSKLMHIAEKERLLAVSGLYWAKDYRNPQSPAAWRRKKIDVKENRYTYDAFEPGPFMMDDVLIPVDVTGAGCLLVKADAFRQLDESDCNKPFFQWGVDRKDSNGRNLPQLSEDLYFCERLKEIDTQPYIYTGVRCGHECSAVKSPRNGLLKLSKM